MKNRSPRIIDGSREMTKEEIMDLLVQGEYCIISTIGDDGYPYGFPMSYVVIDEEVYFHCALDGHKLDNLKYNNKVSLCVVGKTHLIPEELDTSYESIVLFGKAEEVRGEYKIKPLQEIVAKYSKGFEKLGDIEIARDKDITAVIKISIEDMSGKVRRWPL